MRMLSWLRAADIEILIGGDRPGRGILDYRPTLCKASLWNSRFCPSWVSLSGWILLASCGVEAAPPAFAQVEDGGLGWLGRGCKMSMKVDAARRKLRSEDR